MSGAGHDGQRHEPEADGIHQHHRGDRRLVGVVVLTGVLEDLLDGAGRPREGHGLYSQHAAARVASIGA